MLETDRVTLSKAIEPTHYSLELSPDFTTLEFGCLENINITVKESGISEITLHSKEINVLEVLFKNAGSEKNPTLESISYNMKLTTVTFIFDGELPVGEAVLTCKFKGILNGDMSGFYKSNYSDADGNKKVMASTQFEALDARRAFLCVDEPGVKATFTVCLIILAHHTAVSNMPEVSCAHVPGGKKKVVFDISPKMSTYLLAWAVGEFDFLQATTKGGVALRVFCPPGRAQQGAFALDAGVRALDFYDDFFQVPYPLPKMDMMCITEFAAGAMENWGLVTYREVDLMIDSEKASSQQKQRVAIVVAHELAHQWFGNLVTMEWWDGLWLNEGFAAFMEHFCVDALYPEYKIWEQYTTDAYGAAQKLDALRTSHSIIVPIKHAEEVEQVFDAISYCKGSTVVNMVLAVIGKEHFRSGLSLYMKRHAYGNTETVDLWNSWSEVSGQNIAELMDMWTNRMGYPYLTVVSEAWTPTSVEMTLKQDWFLADGSGATLLEGEEGKEIVWSVPLLFASSESVSNTAVIMNKKVQTFTIPLSGAGDWIKINTGQYALARVAHSPEMTKRLLPALADKTLSSVDRAALLSDAYALAKAGNGSVEAVMDVVRSLVGETNSTVWDGISAVLGGMYVLLEHIGGSPFSHYKAFGKDIVLQALGRVGWDSKPEDDHSAKLLRTTVIALLSMFASDDEAVLKEARRRFDGHFTDPLLLPSEYKSTVYKIILQNGGEKEYKQVKDTYYATEDNVERKYAMNSLGAIGIESLKLATLDWAVKSGDIKLQDFFYPIGAVGASPAGCELAWKYLKENFSLIQNKLAKASASLMDAVVIYSTMRFCTAEKATEIEAFFKANPLPKSERRISQSVESMRSTSAFIDRIKASQLMSETYWTK
mmetsp:Transcript_12349/g.11966  ORF Transcript_12349/g.11966 Transcript_12349/m.11966 type:complete len:881 (-) Transcript_12349:131-2773(-)